MPWSRHPHLRVSATDEALLEILCEVERTREVVRIAFDDGEEYRLRIVSTAHAEEGGDIVADVVESIASKRPGLWQNDAMNFYLKDVVRVDGEMENLFVRLAE